MTAGFSEDGRQAISAIASRHGFGVEAAETMAEALLAGNGGMAQFSHPELGGMGQWSRGGMLMIGDMFDNGLKARVGSLAEDLATAIGEKSIAADDGPAKGDETARTTNGGSQAGGLRTKGAPRLGGNAWWPSDLGAPSSSGSQNGRRYAVFPGSRRLAVEQDGRVSLYDSGEYDISGVSQAQGSRDTLRFSGRNGSIELSDLVEIQEDKQGKGVHPG